MEPGYLVEFFEEKRVLCGVVLELKGERLHVLTQNSRELTLARKRILRGHPALPAGASRQQCLDYLQEAARQREALKAGIRLADLWELLSEENQALSEEDLAELWFGGQTSADQVAAMGRALHEDKFYFKYKNGLWVPNLPEVVTALQEKARREEEARRELEEAAACLKAAWETGEIPQPAWRERLVALLKDMAVLGEEAPEYQRGKAFLQQAGLTMEDAAFRLLVRLRVFEEDENLDLYRLEVPTEFSPEAQNEAQQVARTLMADPHARIRADLTHLECLTIDGERTRDFDDALSLEPLEDGWRLGIHIADVSSLVEPGAALDAEAQERGTSIYLPERRLPMFPEEISENTLSLVAQEERLALSFLVDLSPEADIRDWRILPSRIKVKRRLTYQEVDQFLAEQDETLATLVALTRKLKARRLAQGGYELKLPEIWVTFNHQGGIHVIVEDQETVSHQLVSEAMVLANWLAARFLAERGLPAIYRAQPEPREPIDTREPKDLLKLWLDRKKLSRVVMDFTPQPHWGLGLPEYTFATSPIRRYLDLVIHRQILGALNGGTTVYSQEELEKILMTIEPAMRRAGLLKARRLRYWLLKYLAGQVGQKKEVLAVEPLPNRWRVLFPDLLLEAFLTVPPSLDLKPGDTVRVRLDKVSPREDVIKLSLA
ncbi:MAG: VacB/RNase II family 3'-5' exoribonuclease [Deltaproteobacteria bacterium]|nr:VacB/RNase II family 3'-5' exoribonuclease [Deltaproteobacteria bacterium]